MDLPARVRLLSERAAAVLREEQEADLVDFGVRMDRWFDESSLYDGGEVSDLLDRLAESGLAYRDEGAVWHRTGDMGYQDERGRIWLLGRVGEDVRGHWPYAVEAPLEAIPWVERCALLDVEGEAVLACVLREPPRDAESLLRERSGVDRVVRLRRIPVDDRHNVKVDRDRTRRLVLARPEFSANR